MAITGIKEILTIDTNCETPSETELALSERSEELNIRLQNKDMRNIVSELKRTMRKLGLKSLSAPAIGYRYRIFCIDFKDTEIQTFINPIITQVKGLSLSKETCTSIPDKTYIRPRNNDITVMYMKPTGEILSRQLIGAAAFVFQHEMDHLDGLLLSDIGLEVDKQWDDATQEEREEVINAYLDSLDLKQKEIQKEINENEDLKQMHDAVDFMTSVAKGETKLESSEEESTQSMEG